jgi:hypothetical protein
MFYRFNTTTKKLGSYATFAAAQDTGNPQPIFSTEGELRDATAISNADMVVIYNQFADKPVTKFSDREAAARRTWAVVCGQDLGDVGNPSEGAKIVEDVQREMADDAIEAMNADENGTLEGNSTAATDTDNAGQQPEGLALEGSDHSAPTEEPAKRGRKNGTGEFAGKRIYALKQVNPRRIGTSGFNSYEIIRGKTEGVTYDEYIAAGGVPRDLRWDIDHKWTEVK